MKRIFKNYQWYFMILLLGIVTISSCKKVEHGLDESVVSINKSTPSSVFLGSTFEVGFIANNVRSFTLSLDPAAGGESVYTANIENPDNKYILTHEISVPAGEAWLGDFIIKISYGEGGNVVEKTKPITFVEGDPVFYLVGGSTSAGWEPSAALPMKLYKDDDEDVSKDKFEIFTYLVAADGGFKFLPTQDGWDGGLGKASEGKLTTEEGENNLTVEEDGFYRIRIDRELLTYEIEKTTWGIIGDATAGGWDADTDMTFVGGKGSYTWTITTNLKVGELKFRANDDWAINMGGTESKLVLDGDNIAITKAGNYTITMTLAPEGYTAQIKSN